MSYPSIKLLNYSESGHFYKKLDKVVEYAGRTCYLSYNKMNKYSYKHFVPRVVHTFKHESIAGHTFFRILLIPQSDEDIYYYAYHIINNADGNIQVNIIPFAEGFSLLVSGNYRSFKRMYDKDKMYGAYFLSYLKNITNLSLFDNFSFVDNEFNLLPFRFVLIRDINQLTANNDIKLKHSYATFLFSNVNRTFSHQLVRHMGIHLKNSYSEMSQRYVDPTKYDNIFTTPYVIDNNNDIKYLYNTMVKNEINNYRVLKTMIDKKFKSGKIDIHKPEELARDVLPNAMNTRIVMSATLESWKYWVNIRSQPAAQYHIRYAAKSVNNILNNKISFWEKT